MRNTHFFFDPNYTPLNNGSYGAYPKALRNHQHDLQDRIEAHADPFIRFETPKLLLESRAAAASLLGALTDEVVFVPNAATALNTVLRDLKFIEGDTILYFSTAYGACEKTIQNICEVTPAMSRCIDVTFTMDDALLVSTLEETVKDYNNHKELFALLFRIYKSLYVMIKRSQYFNFSTPQ